MAKRKEKEEKKKRSDRNRKTIYDRRKEENRGYQIGTEDREKRRGEKIEQKLVVGKKGR